MGEQKSALILILVLCFAIVSISSIGITKALDTIYIRADGSVEGTDKILGEGDVFTLISDINGSIAVERDSVVLDGAGHGLQGDGNENGITLSDINNVTVKNLTLSNFNIGVVIMRGSEDNRILENTLTDNFRGLDLTGSENNTISGNYISNNTYGIALENNHNKINNNIISNNSNVGIFLYGAGFNIINGNNLTNNEVGIGVSISHDNIIYHNNFVNNTDHVETDDSSGIWDLGEEGNNWDNYTGHDSDGDGVGDTPYVINENNQDNYPLMTTVIIPEFPSWTILPLIIMLALTVVFVRRKLRKRGLL